MKGQSTPAKRFKEIGAICYRFPGSARRGDAPAGAELSAARLARLLLFPARAGSAGSGPRLPALFPSASCTNTPSNPTEQISSLPCALKHASPRFCRRKSVLICAPRSRLSAFAPNQIFVFTKGKKKPNPSLRVLPGLLEGTQTPTPARLLPSWLFSLRRCRVPRRVTGSSSTAAPAPWSRAPILPVRFHWKATVSVLISVRPRRATFASNLATGGVGYRMPSGLRDSWCHAPSRCGRGRRRNLVARVRIRHGRARKGGFSFPQYAKYLPDYGPGKGF